jgi:peptide-methionine (S)-S-oxide reductase
MTEEGMETATLAGGCFWCLEAVYQQITGVQSVVSGYAGGQVENPSYDAVCNGSTGHAEVVQIMFDPDAVRYQDLLEVFFTIHDPTTLNRQGNDVGTQYRSAIFYHTEEQRLTARRVMMELSQGQIWKDPIVTKLEPFQRFYPAEAYHQEYYQRNASQPYCQVVVEPKVAKARKLFLGRLIAQ